MDSHIPRLAACIRDPNELVRTQALALLANLLQKVMANLNRGGEGARDHRLWVV